MTDDAPVPEKTDREQGIHIAFAGREKHPGVSRRWWHR